MKTKKKRLEDAGWKVGSPADFLNITPEESLLIELKLREVQKSKKNKKAVQHKNT